MNYLVANSVVAFGNQLLADQFFARFDDIG